MRRLRSLAAGRKAVVLVGGLAGAAALVLALTLVPPGGDSSGVAADQGAQAEAQTEPAQPAESPPGGGPARSGLGEDVSDADATAAIVALLRERERCFERLELTCLEQVVQPGSALEASDRARLAAAQAGEASEGAIGFRFEGARVVGRMGEAWLAELPYADGEREPASILVMRSEAGWRLREIFG